MPKKGIEKIASTIKRTIAGGLFLALSSCYPVYYTVPEIEIECNRWHGMTWEDGKSAKILENQVGIYEETFSPNCKGVHALVESVWPDDEITARVYETEVESTGGIFGKSEKKGDRELERECKGNGRLTVNYKR
jgi:hypothetical protein